MERGTDQQVYALYGQTPEEIAIVEGWGNVNRWVRSATAAIVEGTAP